MQQLVPQFILDCFARDETSGSFQAAALFVDISGFSEMTDALMAHGQHGSEVLATVMGDVFDPLVHSVYAHGGFVATLAGDAFTALFPKDVGGGGASRRAVTAAAEMQEGMADISRQDTPYGSFDVAVKVGVATGDVTWALVTDDAGKRAAYYFYGRAIDGCVHAQTLAGPEEIVLTSVTRQELGETVAAEPCGDHYRLMDLLGDHLPPGNVEPPRADPEAMSRFFPDWPPRQAQRGEFRQVLSLFVSLPAVNTEGQLNIFMQTVFSLMDRYGGLLNKIDLGDKGAHLVLFWGAPTAYENDIERVLSFILALQTQTAIPVHAGITERISRAGYVGGAWRGEYTCYGRGVNLAARFMTATPRGEIWLDENTARRARAQFEIEYLGEKSFKGFADRQKVYVLLERKESVQTLYEGPLVGRQQELQALADFVEPIFQGHYAGMLTVRGEAGIGKSRLLHTFQANMEASVSDVRWARCQTDEILRESLNPFRYWLRDYFGISDGLAEARNKRSFNRRLDALIATTADGRQAGILDQTRSFLAALVELHWSDSLYQQLDAQGRYESTLLGLVTLLQAESRLQPVILFLEDIQWLDNDSRKFLQRLTRVLTSGRGEASGMSEDYPIAILATSRLPEADLPSVVPPTSVFNLEQLERDDLARLIETHLGMPGSRRLVSLLNERTEGNPFFVEQMLRFLQERGLLRERGKEQDVVVPANGTMLPGDVRSVMVARLDQLAQDVKETVQTASVLGREFEVRLLGWMLGDDDLSSTMTRGEAAAIWSALNEMRYLFRHALLRDTAYRTQVRARRRELHALAAEAVENLYSGELQKHYGELAHHCERAELRTKARHYLWLAAESAKESYQNVLALDYYTRALAHTPERNLEDRYALYRQRAEIYALLGNQENRMDDLEALAKLASAIHKPEKRADVLSLKALYANDIGDYAKAVRLSGEAISLAQSAGAAAIEIGAFDAWANALLRQGKLAKAAKMASKGRDLALQEQDRSGEGRLLNSLGQINFERGELAAARAFFEKSLHIARELGERRGEAQALNNLGMIAGYQGDHLGAERYYEQSLSIAREIGERSGEGLVLGNLGWLAGMRGDYARARTLAAENVKIAREAGDRYSEAYALINLSSFSIALGKYEEALAQAQKGRDLARQSGDRSAQAWSLTYSGHGLLSLGQAPEAKEAYAEALELREELQQPVLAMEPAAGLARISLATGDVVSARKHLQSLLSHLNDGGTLEGTDDPLRVYLTAYLFLDTKHDPRAHSLLQRAYNLLQERANRARDEASRRHFLEKIPHHLQIVTAWEQRHGHPAADASIGHK